MQKKRYLRSSSGSAPLELASLVAVLLLPMGPMLSIFGEVFNSIAAESIARHALRAAILKSPLTSIDAAIASSVESLADSWQREATFSFDCGRCQKGDLIHLQVRVGNATALQVAGLEPK